MSHSLRRVIVLAFCVMLLAVPLSAGASTTVTVQPPTMNGWGFGWDSANYDGSAGFAIGPAPAPLGVGSAQFKIGADYNTRPTLGTAGHASVRLADITALSYATYVAPTSGDSVAPTLNLNVDYDLTDANTTWQGRLVFEPYMNGAVTKGAWQTWNTLTGVWWASGAPGSAICGQSTPCSTATILANWPNAGVRSAGGVIIKAGGGSSGWANFTGYIDALTFNDTVYDFEPASVVYVDDDWASTALWADPDGAGPATGIGLDAFAKIQPAIDAVPAGGTVNVFPGAYDETASGRYLYNNTGPYQFGLFIGQDKDGLKLQGVKSDGSPITAYDDVATTITTNATNSFGASGTFVEGDNVVISGLGLGRNIPGDNKTVEIIGENVTLKNNVVDLPDGGSLYFGDWRYDSVNNVSYITKYTVEGNWLKQGSSVDISSGAGYTGPASDRKIINNKFTADAAAPNWALVSFNGVVPSVGWFVYPTSGATITSNDFSGSTQYIRSRGTVNEASFDWAAYWSGNTFNKAAMATTDGDPANPRAYDYMSGSYLMNNTKRIGSVIQAQVDVAQAGDTVLVKAGTYVENITLNKSLSLLGPNKDTAGNGTRAAEATITGGLKVEAGNVTVAGLKVVDGYQFPASELAGVHVIGGLSNVTVKNNRFERGGTLDLDASRGVINEFGGTTNLKVEGNYFTGWHTGVYLQNADADVLNNVMQDNMVGLSDDGATDVLIKGNEFNSNDFEGVGIGLSITQLNVTENKFIGNAAALNNYTTTEAKAENNWWGSACGPAAGQVSGPVDYTPWWVDATGSGSSEGGTTITPGMSGSAQSAVINCAAPGSTITYQPGTYPGGVVITTNGVTINLNGATIGAGSPAYTIDADDVTINGPAVFNGNTTDPGVLVKTGADNFTLDGVEIKNWSDGVRVEGSHASLKLVNNWLHDNGAGFRFNGATALSGVVTIEGNLFKFNTGDGIANESAVNIPAKYNSWGNIGGPAAGDGVSANVTATPFTFVELFTDAALAPMNVVEGDTFTVQVQGDAAGMYAAQYKLTYDKTLLVVQSVSTSGDFGACTNNTATAGTVTSYCALQAAPDLNGTGKLVNTITFLVDPDASHDGEDSWTTYLDLKHNDGLAAAARDGIKAWVNNAGFGDPSVTTKDITDTQDGTIIIAGLAQYTGYIDLQGRTNDSGATLKVYNQAAISGATELANASSAGSGAYTTVYVSGQRLVIGQTYYFVVDRALYLPTTATTELSWADFKMLDNRPATMLGTVVLLGGDATNDNLIDVNDAGVIGGAYGNTGITCGAGACVDVTGDSKVDILDLTLMGGNYNKTFSPWTE